MRIRIRVQEFQDTDTRNVHNYTNNYRIKREPEK